MTIIEKVSDKSLYCLHNGKLVKIHATTASRGAVWRVDDATFANLVTAYGAAVGT